MEGAPLSPASSDTQSPRSPLWDSEAQEMEEHTDQYSCGWVFFLLIMVPTFECFITVMNGTEDMVCVCICQCLCVSLTLRLQSESQQLTEEEEKEPMENREVVRNLHRCTRPLVLWTGKGLENVLNTLASSSSLSVWGFSMNIVLPP